MSEDTKTAFKFKASISDGRNDTKVQDFEIHEAIASSGFEERSFGKIDRFDSGGPMADDSGFEDFNMFDDGGVLF